MAALRTHWDRRIEHAHEQVGKLEAWLDSRPPADDTASQIRPDVEQREIRRVEDEVSRALFKSGFRRVGSSVAKVGDAFSVTIRFPSGTIARTVQGPTDAEQVTWRECFLEKRAMNRYLKGEEVEP